MICRFPGTIFTGLQRRPTFALKDGNCEALLVISTTRGRTHGSLRLTYAAGEIVICRFTV